MGVEFVDKTRVQAVFKPGTSSAYSEHSNHTATAPSHEA